MRIILLSLMVGCGSMSEEEKCKSHKELEEQSCSESCVKGGLTSSSGCTEGCLRRKVQERNERMGTTCTVPSY